MTGFEPAPEALDLALPQSYPPYNKARFSRQLRRTSMGTIRDTTIENDNRCLRLYKMHSLIKRWLSHRSSLPTRASVRYLEPLVNRLLLLYASLYTYQQVNQRRYE